MSDSQENSSVQGAEPRAMAVISDALHDPIPDRLIQQKKKGGTQIDFCPWYFVQKILNYKTNSFWEYRIKDREIIKDRICVTAEITIHAAEGSFSREATGSETLDTDSYGDFQSNAESMALRRAAARFGLGLHLYHG